jgi:D-serine dehydratase
MVTEVGPMKQTDAEQATALQAISPLHKGLGRMDEPLGPAEIAGLGWNLLKEDLSLPCAVLYLDKLRHNLEWMREFIGAYGVKLAPHGKATMAPRLFEMQLEAGAWGMTLATAHQTQVAWRHGVRRVLMANQLVGRQNMAVVSEMLNDPGFLYYCLVDSVEQVEQLGTFFAGRRQRLQVLLELGVMGGRTGVRDEEQLQQVLAALARWKQSIVLCGIEVYEGVLDDETAIRTFLKSAVEVMRRLLAERRLECAPALLSGAGSAWYDVVAEEFSSAGFGDAVEIVLRPGCYLTHDVGSYKKAQARIMGANQIARKMSVGLLPALHIWAYVQSVPEAEKAIIGMGKRDVAFDSGLPAPALHFRAGWGEPKAAPAHWVVTKLMDQHAYLEIRGLDEVRVGDMIGFDISHPCLTFDKWRVLPVVDAEYRVVDVVQTYF